MYQASVLYTANNFDKQFLILFQLIESLLYRCSTMSVSTFVN